MEVHHYDPYNFTLNGSSNFWQLGAIATAPAAAQPWAKESWADAEVRKIVAYLGRKALVITDAELRLMASAAIVGESSDPVSR